jgi:hypothetical protein
MVPADSLTPLIVYFSASAVARKVRPINASVQIKDDIVTVAESVATDAVPEDFLPANTAPVPTTAPRWLVWQRYRVGYPAE